jgi:hypothetical protein
MTESETVLFNEAAYGPGYATLASVKTAVRRWLALLLVTAILGPLVACASPPTSWQRPELEYFKAVNRAGPPRDPEDLLLLMGQYASANMHREGIEFFSTLLKDFAPRLSDREKSVYLAAIGLLRAGHADEVFLLKRIGWVNETIDILERAKRLSNDQVFVVRWMSGSSTRSFPASLIRERRPWQTSPGA